MQDIQSEEPIPCSISAWKKQAAAALADIHADNLGLAERQPFLPPRGRRLLETDYNKNLC